MHQTSTPARARVTPIHAALTATLASMAVLPDAAHADEPVLIAQVVVSGSRTATALSETPLAIGVVTEGELERDKPKTMGDIINRIPGVYWNDLGNEQHSMAIRQPVGTNPVYQYLEDGIPIRPLGVFNHNAMNELNMSGAGSVEVVKGPASSLYGSNAVGGAVNFLTAAPSPAAYAFLGARTDTTAGFTRLDAAASNTWNRLGLRVSHYSSHRSNDNWQQYSGGSKDSTSLRGEYELTPSSTLRATLTHTDLDADMTGSVFEDDYRNHPGKSINTFTYRKDIATRTALAWEGATSDRGQLTVTLFRRRDDHGQLPAYTINSCTASACRGTINNNHVDSIGVDVKQQRDFDWLASRLVAGLYLDRSRNPYVSDNLSITRDPASGRYVDYRISSATRPAGVRDYDAAIRNVAAFAQWEFSPARRLHAVLGGRFDTIGYDFHNNLSPSGSANYGAPDETRSYSRFSPKIGATYAFNARTSGYLNLSQGFTPPEVSQLYGTSAIPDLRPATYDNHELGLRAAFLGGALKTDAALYRLDGRDTIVSYSSAPGVSENRNAGRTRSEGIEFGATYARDALDLRFATAVARHRFLSFRASPTLIYDGKDMPQAPRDLTSAEVGYRILPGLRAAIEVVHQGAYWMNNANTVRYPGHALVNLRVDWKLANGWECWLQGRNLGDRHYADSATSSYSGAGTYSPNTQNQYTPGAPRSIMLGLAYTYGRK